MLQSLYAVFFKSNSTEEIFYTEKLQECYINVKQSLILKYPVKNRVIK